ncbi:hypothetical protein STCU_04003 [Strigomonas culicis]|uniref:Ankyrin repeat protein n=1 Tax=Strigomonas culicis TaxID=28005 RepID=S9W3Y5_9TRYP|nr:hypothetical protein STCU_06955 [Strigomonas culicis]EPY30565.1 hypothetical protein STCU_04003 [Strigomonas culicis]|eukprot:EPY24886.1 hypothetical protein STCU_06955 [Strigomonas culicis]
MTNLKKNKFTFELHKCLCNNEKEALKQMTQSADFIAANMTSHIYLELVERRWDNDTISAFVKIGTDEQLSVLASCIVMYSSIYPIDKVFTAMQNTKDTIEKYNLKGLFMTACDRGDTDMVQAMIKHGCFDVQDGRPIMVICRREIDKAHVDEELIRSVLKALPGFTATIEALKEKFIPLGKNAASRELVLSLLSSY